MKHRTHLILLVLNTYIFGLPDPLIKDSHPGMMILEFNVDSVWIQNGKFHTNPKLSVNVIPGEIPIPCFQTPLLDIPVNAILKVFRGKPKYLFQEEITLNPYERSSDGVSLTPYGKSSTHSFVAGDVGLQLSGKVSAEDITVLKTSVVDIIDGRWVWYPKTSVQLKWSGTKTGKLLSEKMRVQPMTPNKSEWENLSHPAPYMFDENLIRIAVDSTGYFRIPLDSLVNQNAQIQNTDYSTFRLWSDGQEQMMYFDEDMGFIFFGEKALPPEGVSYQNNFYTPINYYWLTWGESQGLRYAEESVYPSLGENEVHSPYFFNCTLKIEKDQFFARLGTMNTHDQWDTFDHFFMTPPVNGGTSVNFSLFIPDPYHSTTNQYSVKTEIQGMTTNYHRLTVLLNQNVLGSMEWEGQVPNQFETGETQTLPNTELLDGENQFTLTVEGEYDYNRYDQIYLNWIEISYDRKFVADQDKLVFHRDGNYSTVSQFLIEGFSSPNVILFKKDQSRLRDFILEEDSGEWTLIMQDQILGESPEYHAIMKDSLAIPFGFRAMDPLDDILAVESNYVILAPDSFKQALEPLKNFHNAVFVTPESIYRHYSDGMMDPYAIRSFLTDAYLTWSIQPEFVLLAQQGMWPNQLGGLSNFFDNEFIPSMRIQTEKYGAVSSDFWYTLLMGNDYLPELAIGRFPARTETELAVMVEKTMFAHESPDQTWQNSILMIGGYELDFREQTEALLNGIIGQGYFPKRIYIDQYSEGGPFWGTTDSLLSYMERGVSYINFLGHGGGAVWGDRSLFTLDDLEELSNENKQPFVTSMTCFTGDVTNPNSLGRRMMGYESGGAVGWFGSAGLGWIINDYLLLQPIEERLFSDESLPIGKLLNEAKMEYLFTNTTFHDIAISQIFQFNLTGDPALVFMSQPTISPSTNSQSVSAGATVDLDFNAPNVDSLTIQWLDGDNFPLSGTTAIQNLSIQVPDTAHSGSIKLIGIFKDENSENVQFNIPFEVDGSFIQIMMIEPEYPVEGDSISLKVFVDDPIGIQQVECWVSDSLFSGMVAEESHYFLENKIPVSSTGSTVYFKIRVLNVDGNETWSAVNEITTFKELDIQPILLSPLDDQRIGIAGKIENKSNQPGNALATLSVKWDSDINETELFSDSVYVTALGFITQPYEFPMRSGTHRFFLKLSTPNNQQQDTTFVLDSLITAIHFWITPGLGTTEDLSSHDTILFSEISLTVAAGQVEENKIVTFSGHDNILIASQPSLSAFQVGTEYMSFEIALEDDISWNAVWETGKMMGDDTLLFIYDPSWLTWKPIQGNWVDSSAFEFSGTGSGEFAWMASSDKTPPFLEASINGQVFLRNSYLNKNPEITILAQDENGIDLDSDNTKYLRNGNEWDPGDQMSVAGKGPYTSIILKPELSVLDSSLAFIIADRVGNISDTLTLQFIVSNKLELFDYGNYPNPFKDQTRFTYELSENVENFSLNIYSVDGRRIKTFDETSSLTELDPSAGGFHEIIWDGRDDQGDFVGNGVYFYQIQIKSGDHSITKTGKVAKAR